MINKLANDIARAAQLKLVMINSEMEKQAELQKQADLMETLRALGAQAGDGLRNLGAQTSEALAPYIAKAKEGLSAAGAKAKQEFGAAVDQAKAFKQSIENVPVMKDRIIQELQGSTSGINDNLSQLISGLENKGYALGAGGALAGGLGGLGLGSLRGSGASQSDSGNTKKNKKKK